jgi:vancomycin resistance protein YoaR
MVAARKAEKQTIKRHTRHAARTVKTTIARHYTAYMPTKKHHRVLVWAVFLFVSISIGIQMAYPLDRGLPLASVQGKSMGMATHNQMAEAVVKAFDASKLKLTIGKDKTIEYPLKLAGAEPDTEQMISKMSDYPFWQRFIPGSILWQPAQLSVVDVYYANKPLQAFAVARSKELTFPSQPARLSIDGGQIKVSDAVEGSTVDAKKVVEAINAAIITLGQTTVVTVPATREKPINSAKDLEKVRQQAETILAHKVTIASEGEQFKPSAPEIASWILLNTDSKGVVTLTIDKEKIKAYLNTLNEKVGKQPGQTDITIVDGREAGRTTGATGRLIDVGVISDQLASALAAPELTVAITAPLIEVQPSVIYNSKYTATQAGLQAYVEDTARTKNMRIVIEQLDGEKWYAHARETESIPSASTFKLYLAKILFDKIDAGEIHWNDPMLDTTVAGCFERMTVASTNPCAESWIAQWGRQYINDYVYRLGFSTGTTFISDWATQTTAADLTKYMKGLYDGTILTGANRDRLLDSLGRHPYRYGIPTGSAGIVHDKVGFLWDFVHDTAIVQHPRGTYIMTIMTRGQSYAAIAAVTREVERIMYP